MKYVLIFSYLFAIVLANLVVTKYGAAALPITAFVLIPFDLIARDQLHEYWSKNGLKLKMFLLVVSGSVLSYLLNKDALNIAIASSVSFLVAGFFDYLVYHYLGNKKRAVKMICSNTVSSIIDSILFQQIAFAQILVFVAIHQSLLKICGTIIWTFVFIYFLSKSKR